MGAWWGADYARPVLLSLPPPDCVLGCPVQRFQGPPLLGNQEERLGVKQLLASLPAPPVKMQSARTQATRPHAAEVTLGSSFEASGSFWQLPATIAATTLPELQVQTRHHGPAGPGHAHFCRACVPCPQKVVWQLTWVPPTPGHGGLSPAPSSPVAALNKHDLSKKSSAPFVTISLIRCPCTQTAVPKPSPKQNVPWASWTPRRSGGELGQDGPSTGARLRSLPDDGPGPALRGLGSPPLLAPVSSPPPQSWQPPSRQPGSPGRRLPNCPGQAVPAHYAD